MKLISTLIVSMVLVLSGCASPAFMVAKSYPSTSPDKVSILFEPPQQEYEILAKGSVHAIGAGSLNRNTQNALSELKSEAAKIGGNAVIVSGPVLQSTFTTGNYSGNATNFGNSTWATGTGTAISGGGGDATIQATIIRIKE